MENIQITKQTIKVGNGSGVLLPKDWLGSEVTILLRKRPLNMKEDILKLLKPNLKEVIGIYIAGSYARGEATLISDIDILIITNTLIKLPKLKNYHLICVTINSVKRALENNPILVYPMLMEAKPLLNEYLLNELKEYKINPLKFKWYIETSKSSLRVDKEFLNIEEIEENKILDTPSVIYSLILRLRGAYIIDCILKNKFYFNKDLIKFVNKKLREKIFEEMYSVYRAIRDNKKIPKHRITLDDTKRLYRLVEDIIKKEEKLICQIGKKD